MPMWRCPQCTTPQAEAARCWVCHRSNTSCASCRNFRRSISAGVGYCALDRGRGALNGQEIRPCWEPAIALRSATPPAGDEGGAPGTGTVALETLVNVDSESGRFWPDTDR